LEHNIKACQRRFKLTDSNVPLVFDRGIISADNAEKIEDAHMKYISALDRNQIPGCGIDLESFKALSIDDMNPRPAGFKKYADDLYFYDHGVIGNKRLVVGFNPVRFHEERKCRQEKIDFFLSWLRLENKRLKAAERDRRHRPTENRVLAELKRLKIKKYFETPTLDAITVTKRLKNGKVKEVKLNFDS